METHTTSTSTYADRLTDIIDSAELRDPELSSTQEMPVVANDEIVAASTYTDEELAIRMWQVAIDRMQERQQLAAMRASDLTTTAQLPAIEVEA
jgi:hypothetical protein